jgi:hypothetical protein
MKATFTTSIYSSVELEVVAQAHLGRGKLPSLTGTNILAQPVAKQKECGIVDTELTTDLAKCDNVIIAGILEKLPSLLNQLLNIFVKVYVFTSPTSIMQNSKPEQYCCIF